MYSELIVMSFSDETAALKAKQAMEQLRNSLFLGVLNAIVVTRDKTGKVVVHQQWEMPSHNPIISKQLPRLLVESIFGKPEENGVQELIHIGVDEAFVRNIVSALSPDSSLFLSYLQQGSMVDTKQVLEVLSQLKGTLYHTTIPPEVEQAIFEQAEQA